ncbi:MAG: DNA mismatch repair protein MutS [Bacillota bacterium]|nr:DNA mismatch repair protein MutS [Bacillota bacterium]
MSYTPMMQQYLDIKESYKDCILFFRLGDFYEMFFEDAIVASKAMEVTLTGKSCGLEERAPMCGVPYHAVDTYAARLVEKGYKVAICEQMEDPALTKGLVKREVVQIITPGAIISGAMLNEKENNYLASVYLDGEGAALAYCDVSTGEIAATDMEGRGHMELLLNELVKIKARQVLNNEEAEEELLARQLRGDTTSFEILGESYYTLGACQDRILAQFRVKALAGLGLEGRERTVKALGSLLTYLRETQKQGLSHISALRVYDTGSHMALDKSTIKNLELTETLFEKKVQGSLLGVLDKTHTAMGSRKMKQWIREPLNRLEDIRLRLDAVETLTEQVLLRNDIKEALKRVYDLERLAGRVACGNANGRDLAALAGSISALGDVKAGLAGCGDPLLEQLEAETDPLEDLRDSINGALVEEPPFTIKEGGLIRQGHSRELDELKLSIADAQAWIAGLEGSERERTGIKNLKVGFNKVFGYYIEVTRSYYELIPENYIRKQTLVNCERFITPELKEMESLVLNAETKINRMEYELFQELRQEIQEHIGRIQATSSAVAALDVLASFAEVGSRMGYCKPRVEQGDIIMVEKGRHPVIEQTIKDGVFVSNDTYLDRQDHSLLLITGPNMSGKSTYMRQTALIVLMAQMGCFVPAEKAEIGVVDRVYTRIGASDNLAQGQSTFFVEMSELAYILNTATERSLVILDEIGRGTSTYDGLSIAWAAAEHLCHEKRRIRTLFATHYHEMTSLEGRLKGLKNLNVDVQELGGNIVFLHKIVEGSASRSYGIHVARLAGVPGEILERATEKLKELEESRDNAVSLEAPGTGGREEAEKEGESLQLSFFGFAPNPIVERLKALDLMEITPSKAFELLEELQEAARKE